MNSIKPFQPRQGLKPAVRKISTLDETPSPFPFERDSELTFRAEQQGMGEMLLMLLEALRQYRAQSTTNISVGGSTTVIRQNICNIVNNFRAAAYGSADISLRTLFSSIESSFSEGGSVSAEQTEQLISSVSRRLNEFGRNVTHNASVSQITENILRNSEKDAQRYISELKKNFEMTRVDSAQLIGRLINGGARDFGENPQARGEALIYSAAVGTNETEHSAEHTESRFYDRSEKVSERSAAEYIRELILHKELAFAGSLRAGASAARRESAEGGTAARGVDVNGAAARRGDPGAAGVNSVRVIRESVREAAAERSAAAREIGGLRAAAESFRKAGRGGFIKEFVLRGAEKTRADILRVIGGAYEKETERTFGGFRAELNAGSTDIFRNAQRAANTAGVIRFSERGGREIFFTQAPERVFLENHAEKIYGIFAKNTVKNSRETMRDFYAERLIRHPDGIVGGYGAPTNNFSVNTENTGIYADFTESAAVFAENTPAAKNTAGNIGAVGRSAAQPFTAEKRGGDERGEVFTERRAAVNVLLKNETAGRGGFFALNNNVDIAAEIRENHTYGSVYGAIYAGEKSSLILRENRTAAVGAEAAPQNAQTDGARPAGGEDTHGLSAAVKIADLTAVNALTSLTSLTAFTAITGLTGLIKPTAPAASADVKRDYGGAAVRDISYPRRETGAVAKITPAGRNESRGAEPMVFFGGGGNNHLTAGHGGAASVGEARTFISSESGRLVLREIVNAVRNAETMRTETVFSKNITDITRAVFGNMSEKTMPQQAPVMTAAADDIRVFHGGASVRMTETAEYHIHTETPSAAAVENTRETIGRRDILQENLRETEIVHSVGKSAAGSAAAHSAGEDHGAGLSASVIGGRLVYSGSVLREFSRGEISAVKMLRGAQTETAGGGSAAIIQRAGETRGVRAVEALLFMHSADPRGNGVGSRYTGDTPRRAAAAAYADNIYLYGGGNTYENSAEFFGGAQSSVQNVLRRGTAEINVTDNISAEQYGPTYYSAGRSAERAAVYGQSETVQATGGGEPPQDGALVLAAIPKRTGERPEEKRREVSSAETAAADIAEKIPDGAAVASVMASETEKSELKSFVTDTVRELAARDREFVRTVSSSVLTRESTELLCDIVIERLENRLRTESRISGR